MSLMGRLGQMILLIVGLYVIAFAFMWLLHSMGFSVTAAIYVAALLYIYLMMIVAFSERVSIWLVAMCILGSVVYAYGGVQ